MNVVNLTNNGLPSPTKLSFDIKNGDKTIGICRISIKNIFLRFELNDEQGNRFTFDPIINKECNGDDESYSETYTKANCFGVGEESNVTVKESITNEKPENINHKPDTNCLDAYEEIKIKLEEDIFATQDSSHVRNDVNQLTVEKINGRIHPQSLIKTNNGEENFEVLMDNPINANQFTVMNEEGNHKQQHSLSLEVVRKRGYMLTDHTNDFQNNKENDFECERRGKIYTEKNHVVEKLFECEVDVNMKAHTVEKRFACEACGKSFTKKSNLKNHTRIHTFEKPLECQVFGKRFTLKSNLKKHARIHTGDKPFKCQFCGKKFTQKSHFVSHTRTHTDEKLFECQVCSKLFAQKNDLNRQTRTHTGEKPFECQVCGKRFTHKSHLVSHTRTHTNEKSFECDVCGKPFKEKSNLNIHKRTHTGDKAFKCEVCGKHFTQKQNLKRHTRTHTGDKPFSSNLWKNSYTEA